MIVWLFLQFVSATLWMACFVGVVCASHWGWLWVLGVEPIATDGALTWVVFGIGLAFTIVSTHMGWLEQQAAIRVARKRNK